jgi:hypothetical protein
MTLEPTYSTRINRFTGDRSVGRRFNYAHAGRSSSLQPLSFLAVARLRDFDFVVRGPLDGEQDASIGFVRDQPQQFSLFIVLLDDGQSAVSNGAGGPIHLI